MNVYMIMCHKNANQVLRLANRILLGGGAVVIHADSHMSDAEYQMLKNESNKCENLHLSDRRIHGVLDQRSLVDIAMEMIRKAKTVERENNCHFSYYALLSGQDYVLKPMFEIERELTEHYPKPYIDCTPYAENNWIYHKFRWNKYTASFYHFIRNRFPKRTIIRKMLMALFLISRPLLNLLAKSYYQILKKAEVEIYGGSAWWILPDVAVKYIFEEYRSNSNVVDLVLKTHTPEETFFQIMTMRSPIKELVEVNSPDMVAQNCKTWAYFSDEGKPFKGHPYVFTMDEFEKLKNSDCWFARKFDMAVDAKVFDALDELS